MMRKAGGSDIVRNRQKMMKRCAFGIAAAVSAIMAVSGASEGETVLAPADMSGTFSSRGIIRYEQAVIDAADLHSIHAGVTEKKNAAVGVLQQLGTKFRRQEGGSVPDRNPDAVQGEMDLSQLGWAAITQAAADSQKIPEGLS